MGLFDSIGDAVGGVVSGSGVENIWNGAVKPVANYGADMGKMGMGVWGMGVQNLTGGVANVGQGFGQIGKGLGDMVTNPIFLIAIGGVVLVIFLKK